MLKKGIWIWENTQPKADEYADFTDSFLYEGGCVHLRISADSNYAVFVARLTPMGSARLS